ESASHRFWARRRGEEVSPVHVGRCPSVSVHGRFSTDLHGPPRTIRDYQGRNGPSFAPAVLRWAVKRGAGLWRSPPTSSRIPNPKEGRSPGRPVWHSYRVLWFQYSGTGRCIALCDIRWGPPE